MIKRLSTIIALVGIAYITISATIDLDNLFNYANQTIPNYINKDNTTTNPIDDKIATLGRVLFYDTNLSSNNTIACASCHQQEFGFGDPAVQSTGLDGGLTGRHSMRLINSRFADEMRFFWDERAATLEEQTTQPIQDHIEMGYSGTNGDPDFNDLIDHLETLPYYQQLFTFAFGDAAISEDRMQLAMAQFVRSIQSFDSMFDEGLVLANNNVQANFTNYSAEENLGKNIFLDPPPNGGAGCASCHSPPEFDIGPNTLNNGVITVAGDPNAVDVTNTRAPSLRDVFDSTGNLNGPLMHDGSFNDMIDVINHYSAIPNDPQNTNLDPRLTPNGQPQNLNLTQQEKDALVAFLKTLSGNDVYTDERWSNPFEPDGSITITGGNLGISNSSIVAEIALYPNPADSEIHIMLSANSSYNIIIYNVMGQEIKRISSSGSTTINVSPLLAGMYLIQIENNENKEVVTKRLIKK